MRLVQSVIGVVLLVTGLTVSGCQSRSVGCTNCLPDVVLTNQRGQSVQFNLFKGKTILLDFIYTSCPGPCVLLTERLSKTARELGPLLGSKVVFASITIDPEHDGARQLAEFASEHDANYRGWWFLTGSPQDIDGVLAEYGLMRQREPSGEMAHIEVVFLIGPKGRLVHRYDAGIINAQRMAAEVRQTVAG